MGHKNDDLIKRHLSGLGLPSKQLPQNGTNYKPTGGEDIVLVFGNGVNARGSFNNLPGRQMKLRITDDLCIQLGLPTDASNVQVAQCIKDAILKATSKEHTPKDKITTQPLANTLPGKEYFSKTFDELFRDGELLQKLRRENPALVAAIYKVEFGALPSPELAGGKFDVSVVSRYEVELKKAHGK